MNLIFRLFLTFNATLFLWVIFLIKNIEDLPNLYGYGKWLWPFLLIIFPFLFSIISIIIVPKLSKDEINFDDIIHLKYEDNTFLPNYLGYFFISLSVSSYHNMIFVYGILYLFSFSSQSTYFNPMFLVIGYKFYSLKTKKGTTIYLISRKKYKKPRDIDKFIAFRINDHTWMER